MNPTRPSRCGTSVLSSFPACPHANRPWVKRPAVCPSHDTEIDVQRVGTPSRVTAVALPPDPILALRSKRIRRGHCLHPQMGRAIDVQDGAAVARRLRGCLRCGSLLLWFNDRHPPDPDRQRESYVVSVVDAPNETTYVRFTLGSRRSPARDRARPPSQAAKPAHAAPRFLVREEVGRSSSRALAAVDRAPQLRLVHLRAALDAE